MIALQVALPPDLHRRLALHALDVNASMNELIRLAITDYLNRGGYKPRRPRGIK